MMITLMITMERQPLKLLIQVNQIYSNEINIENNLQLLSLSSLFI
jgi:hypothetical protein